MWLALDWLVLGSGISLVLWGFWVVAVCYLYCGVFIICSVEADELYGAVELSEW